MTCRELAEILIDYVSGEMTPEETERIRKHLEECPPCVFYVRTYELTITVTRRLPMVAMPAKLMDRLREAVKEEGKSEGTA
jgi:anti-sigma factor RsiW